MESCVLSLAPCDQSMRGEPSRPRILFVTSHWPHAPAYGAQQRVLNIARLLSHFGDVSFVIVPVEREDETTLIRTKQEFDVRAVIRPTTIRRSAWLTHRLRHELDPRYMVTDPSVISESDRQLMCSLIRQHDITWVHTAKVANCFRIYRWPHSVLDVDDLQSRLYKTSSESGDRFLRRILDRRMAWIWRRRERMFRDRFSVLATCSENDRRYLSGQDPIYVIPNGFHPLQTRHNPSPEAPRIGFLGTCRYMPNGDGVLWFIRDVWPLIKHDFPTAELRLVGLGTDCYFGDRGPDIARLGWLEDPSDEIASWSAMIVPIRVGGGTRVKIAEAFARKCPVVSTTTGAFGYDVSHGKELLIADSAADFATACASLIRNPQLGIEISERAHKKFLERWTWESFRETVGTVLHECLSSGERARAGGPDLKLTPARL